MRIARVLARLALVAMLAGNVAGCGTIEGIFDSGEEAEGVVEAIAVSSVTVSGNMYTVNADTEFEGNLTGLADLRVGDAVEVEYENKNNERVAREIERGEDDDD